jgi:molecular chaperone GrpE
MEDIKKEEEILEGEKVETPEQIEAEDKEKVEADELTLLQEENGKLKVELDDWKNAYVRKNAEFQNYSKRKDKEVEDLRAYASEKIVERLLGVLDNLERGIEAANNTKDFDSLVKGVEMTLSQMKTITEAEGVTEIDASGEYNPYEHQAMMTESSDEVENDHIIQVLQKGYKLNGKVVRPAMVKVCKK